MPTKVPNPSPRQPPPFLQLADHTVNPGIPQTSINRIQTPTGANSRFSMFMKNSEAKKKRSTHSKPNSRMASPSRKKYYHIRSAHKTNGSNLVRSRSSTQIELTQIRRSSDQNYAQQVNQNAWDHEQQRQRMSVNCSPIGVKGEMKAMLVEPNVFETSMNGLTNSQNHTFQTKQEDEMVYVQYVKTHSNNITLNGSLNGILHSKPQATKARAKPVKRIPEPLLILEQNQKKENDFKLDSNNTFGTNMNIRQALVPGHPKTSQPSSQKNPNLPKMDLSSQRRNFDLDIVYDPDRLNETNLISSKAPTSREGSHLKQSQIGKQAFEKSHFGSMVRENSQVQPKHVRNLSESMLKRAQKNESYFQERSQNGISRNSEFVRVMTTQYQGAQMGDSNFVISNYKDDARSTRQPAPVPVLLNRESPSHRQQSKTVPSFDVPQYAFQVPEQQWSQFPSRHPMNKHSPKFPKQEEIHVRTRSSKELGKTPFPGKFNYRKHQHRHTTAGPGEFPIPESIHNSQNLMHQTQPQNPPNSVKNSQRPYPPNFRSQYIPRNSHSSNSVTELRERRMRQSSHVYKKIMAMKKKQFKKIKSQQNSMRKSHKINQSQRLARNVQRQVKVKMKNTMSHPTQFQRVDLDPNLNPEFFMSGKFRENPEKGYYDQYSKGSPAVVLKKNRAPKLLPRPKSSYQRNIRLPKQKQRLRGPHKNRLLKPQAVSQQFFNKRQLNHISKVTRSQRNMMEKVMPYVLSKQDLMNIKNFQRQDTGHANNYQKQDSGTSHPGYRPKSQSIYQTKNIQVVEHDQKIYKNQQKKKSFQNTNEMSNASFASVQPNIYQQKRANQKPNATGPISGHHKVHGERSSHMSDYFVESVNQDALLSKQNSGQQQQFVRVQPQSRRNSGASLELWYSRAKETHPSEIESSDTLNYSSNPRRSAGNQIFMSSQRPKAKKPQNYFLYSQNVTKKKDFKQSSITDIHSGQMAPEGLESGKQKTEMQKINRPLHELGIDEYKIIFKLLDEKERGSISKDNFRFAELPLQTINQLEPFIKEMLIQDQTLDFQEFLTKIESIVQFNKK